MGGGRMRKPNCIICGGVDGVKMLLDVRQFGLIQLCSRCRKKLEEFGWKFAETKKKPRHVDRSKLSWKQPIKRKDRGMR